MGVILNPAALPQHFQAVDSDSVRISAGGGGAKARVSPYHFHGVREDDAVEPDQVLVVQRVHGVHLSDEVVQGVWLVQHVRFQTLHGHVELRIGGRGGCKAEGAGRSGTPSVRC